MRSALWWAAVFNHLRARDIIIVPAIRSTHYGSRE